MTMTEETNVLPESISLLHGRRPLITKEESMAKTRNERRRDERIAVAGIVTFLLTMSVLWVSVVHALEVTAWTI